MRSVNSLHLFLSMRRNITKSLGVKALFGEEGYSTIERTGYRPTFDVCGIWGGYTGDGAKTVIPSKHTQNFLHVLFHIRIIQRLASW